MPTGSSAAASVRVRNTGTESRSFWLGFDVQDSIGEWHAAPRITVKLEPGEESETRYLSTVPLETSGYYNARVSAWDTKLARDDEGARLTEEEAASAFRVYSEREDFGPAELNTDRWKETSRELGQGSLKPKNVSVQNGQLRLTLPQGTLDGAQIESTNLYGPGFYAARIQVPEAPSSITGFFLYEPPDFESEVDVEIYNDSSRKVLFTTYAGGEMTHSETVELPFNPTEDFHDYAFFYDESSITFYVDGEPMMTYENGVPQRAMKLHVNAWFPDWLSGEAPPSDRHVYVDWIEG